MGQHEDEIHQATLRIHAWLRNHITSKIEPWQPFVSVPVSATDESELSPVATS